MEVFTQRISCQMYCKRFPSNPLLKDPWDVWYSCKSHAFPGSFLGIFQTKSCNNKPSGHVPNTLAFFCWEHVMILSWGLYGPINKDPDGLPERWRLGSNSTIQLWSNTRIHPTLDFVTWGIHPREYATKIEISHHKIHGFRTNKADVQ